MAWQRQLSLAQIYALNVSVSSAEERETLTKELAPVLMELRAKLHKSLNCDE